jgi:hypothetical protein
MFARTDACNAFAGEAFSTLSLANLVYLR